MRVVRVENCTGFELWLAVEIVRDEICPVGNDRIGMLSSGNCQVRVFRIGVVQMGVVRLPW